MTLMKNNGKSWPQASLDEGMLFAREQKLLNEGQIGQQVKHAAMKARTSPQNVPLSVQYAAACVH